MQNINRHLLQEAPAREMSLSPSCAAVVFYLCLRLIHHKGGSDVEVADAILRTVKNRVGKRSIFASVPPPL